MSLWRSIRSKRLGHRAIYPEFAISSLHALCLLLNNMFSFGSPHHQAQQIGSRILPDRI